MYYLEYASDYVAKILSNPGGPNTFAPNKFAKVQYCGKSAKMSSTLAIIFPGENLLLRRLYHLDRSRRLRPLQQDLLRRRGWIEHPVLLRESANSFLVDRRRRLRRWDLPCAGMASLNLGTRLPNGLRQSEGRGGAIQGKEGIKFCSVA